MGAPDDADLTAIEDLTENLRLALTRGFSAGYWFVESVEEPPPVDDEESRRAFEDGKRLASAVCMLISADLADYKADERAYELLAAELNERYGRGLVVNTDELGPGGLAPGFRSRATSAEN